MSLYKTRTENQTSLGLSDFLTQDVLCDKDKKGAYVGDADVEGFTIIGEYKIPKGVATIIGRRFYLADRMSGRFVVLLYDSGNALIHGRAKIVALSPQKDRNLPLAEVNSRSIKETEPLDISKNPTLTIGHNCPIHWFPEDYYIQLRFRPEQDDVTIDYDNSKNVIVIDTLEKQLR